MDPTWTRHEASQDPISPDVLYFSSPAGSTKSQKSGSLIHFNQHGGAQHMRSPKLTVIIILLGIFFATQARAHDRAVNGLLIGSAVGGMVGYIVGSEIQRGYVHHQPVIYAPPPPPPRYYADRPYPQGRRHYRHDYRPEQVCRETVVVRERHGRYHESVRTVCRDRDDWHRPHDRYGYNDRW